MQLRKNVSDNLKMTIYPSDNRPWLWRRLLVAWASSPVLVPSRRRSWSQTSRISIAVTGPHTHRAGWTHLAGSWYWKSEKLLYRVKGWENISSNWEEIEKYWVGARKWWKQQKEMVSSIFLEGIDVFCIRIKHRTQHLQVKKYFHICNSRWKFCSIC